MKSILFCSASKPATLMALVMLASHSARAEDEMKNESNPSQTVLGWRSGDRQFKMCDGTIVDVPSGYVVEKTKRRCGAKGPPKEPDLKKTAPNPTKSEPSK